MPTAPRTHAHYVRLWNSVQHRRAFVANNQDFTCYPPPNAISNKLSALSCTPSASSTSDSACPDCLSRAPSTCLSANLPWLLHGSIGTSLCASGERTVGGTMTRRGSAQCGVRDTCWLRSHCRICTVCYTFSTEHSKRLLLCMYPSPPVRRRGPFLLTLILHHDSAYLAPNLPTCLTDDDLAVSAGHLASAGFRSALVILANQSTRTNTRPTKEEGSTGFGHGPVRDFYLDAPSTASVVATNHLADPRPDASPPPPASDPWMQLWCWATPPCQSNKYAIR